MKKLKEKKDFNTGLTRLGRRLVAAITSDLDFQAGIALENKENAERQRMAAFMDLIDDSTTMAKYGKKLNKYDKASKKADKLVEKAAEKRDMPKYEYLRQHLNDRK